MGTVFKLGITISNNKDIEEVDFINVLANILMNLTTHIVNYHL